jgi:hypothetical protein
MVSVDTVVTTVAAPELYYPVVRRFPALNLTHPEVAVYFVFDV